MTVYIGVDFHPYEQSVAYADDKDGEIVYKRFLHSDKKSIKAFYRKCGFRFLTTYDTIFLEQENNLNLN